MAVDTYATGDDRVQIRLGNDTVRSCTFYDVITGIFNQPSTFAVSLGDGSTTANLIFRITPNLPFQILVNDAAQFSGYTEGRASHGTGESGSELAVHGRSILAKLLTDIEKEESFNAATHAQLIQKALEDYEVFKPFLIGQHPSIISSNEVIRQTRSKSKVTSSGTDDWTDILAQSAGNQGDAYPVLRTKLAEKVIDLIRRHLETVGLFMWDSPTGDIVVGRPNAQQPAIGRIWRTLSGGIKAGNILGHTWREDWAHRYSEIVIFGKTTGRKYTRHTTEGSFSDPDVTALGFNRKKVLRDVNVTSVAHASAIARKHLAAGRREALHLEYTVRGHSAPNILHGGTMVWAPDTVVEVVDDALGYEQNFYVESVHLHRGHDGTWTKLKLVELDTLIFGSDESLAPTTTTTTTSTSTPQTKTYQLPADETPAELSVILYGNDSHAQELLSMNQSSATWDSSRNQFVFPADSTITYVQR